MNEKYKPITSMKEVPEHLRKLRRQYLRYQQAEIIYSISASNNRMANYFSGNWLLTIDELNLQPQRNLYQDIKDGVNNKERPDEDLLGRDENGRMK